MESKNTYSLMEAFACILHVEFLYAFGMKLISTHITLHDIISIYF